MSVQQWPRCPLETGSLFSANVRQCARWDGHSGACYPYMAVISEMAVLIREFYAYPEEVSLEQFIDEAQDAWARRVIDGAQTTDHT